MTTQRLPRRSSAEMLCLGCGLPGLRTARVFFKEPASTPTSSAHRFAGPLHAEHPDRPCRQAFRLTRFAPLFENLTPPGPDSRGDALSSPPASWRMHRVHFFKEPASTPTSSAYSRPEPLQPLQGSHRLPTAGLSHYSRHTKPRTPYPAPQRPLAQSAHRLQLSPRSPS